MRGVPAVSGVRRRAAGAVPVRRAEADVRQLPGALLPARTARTGARHHAPRRAAHVVGTSRPESAALAGWFQENAPGVNPVGSTGDPPVPVGDSPTGAGDDILASDVVC